MPYNYYNAYNPYMQNGYMPYMQNNNQVQRPQEQSQPIQYNRQVLQGGMVTSIDEVKAIGIPLDGSLSYFALADGSAVVSKQLQQDGTSKITVYRPTTGEENEEQVKYVTENDLKTLFGDLNPRDIKDIKEEIKTLKKRIRELTDDLEDKKGE